MSFKASAPGSVMLLGEYAVLHGKHAVVCAVDKRMHVKLTPRVDKQIFISSALGDFQTSISALQIKAPFEFVLAALKEFKRKLVVGCDIEISSDFSDKIGFGSSAAVTVAMFSCMAQWLKLEINSAEHIALARKVIRKVQGSGSGADAAASVLGGVVSYRMRDHASKIADFLPVSLVFSGYKTKTADAIQHVKQSFFSHKKILNDLFKTMDSCVRQGIEKIHLQDWSALGKLMNMQQGMLACLDVSDASLDKLITELRQQPTIFGAKISGSGLGDCVIGLGNVAEDFIPVLSEKGARYIPVAISDKGVTSE